MGMFDQVAAAITQLEGFITPGSTPQYPNGSISYRLNNPGNLMFAGQKNATPVVLNGHTFASFPTLADGQAALDRQIAIDANAGLSLRQFVYKYAPPTENNSAKYLADLSSRLGMSPDDPLINAGDATKIVGEISSFSSAPDPGAAAVADGTDTTGSFWDQLDASTGGDPWLMGAIAVGAIAFGFMFMGGSNEG